MDRSAPGCPAAGAVFGAVVEADAVEAAAAAVSSSCLFSWSPCC